MAGIKIIECHDIEAQLWQDIEEDAQERREAWAREFIEALRDGDLTG